MFDLRFDNNYILEYNSCTVSVDGEDSFTVTPSDVPLYIRFDVGKPYVVHRPKERPNHDALFALLKVKTPSDLERYFTRYGYFFDISEPVTVEASVLLKLVNRIRVLVRLVSSLYDNSVTNEECIGMLAYMILDDTRSLSHVGYHACNASLCDWIYHKATDIPLLERQDLVFDDALAQNYTVPYDEYRFVATHGDWGADLQKDGVLDRQYYAFTKLYTTRLLEYDTQAMVDFAFHLERDYDVIQSFDKFGKPTFYSRNGVNIRNATLLNSLDAITRIVIVNEINANLTNVHFRYSPEMEPYWCYNDLFTALMLSVYTTKPHNTIYRKCANDTCECYFEVNSSNGKK